MQTTSDDRTTTDARMAMWPWLLCWMIVSAAFVNAVSYVYVAANPMLASDNWTFLETFLREAVEGELKFGDFLVKRANFDAGQPFNKLIMLLHYRLFGLDFKIEALFGMLFAALSYAVIYRMAISDSMRHQRSPVFYLAMAATAAVYVSLNSSMIYTYSLVTLSFCNYFFAFLMIYCAWIALRGGRWWPLVVSAVVCGIVDDQFAIITALALIATIALYGLRSKSGRRASLAMGIVLVALLISQIVYALFGDIRGSAPDSAFDAGFWQRIQGLIGQANEAWRWVITPAASSIAYSQSLQYLYGTHWDKVQLLLGLTVLGGNVWFWRQAWCSPIRAAWFMAICLMLLSYGCVAGMLYGRVFLRGAEYLNQPRYVGLYQFNIVALLLMGAACALATVAKKRGRSFLAASCVVLLLAQIPLSRHAWMEVEYIDAYYKRMAADFGSVGRDPGATPPENCTLVLLLCQLPPNERVRAMALLKRHRLNLYSPHFATAYPDLVAAAAVPP